MISRRALLKSIILGAAIAFPVARLRVVCEAEPIASVAGWDDYFFREFIRVNEIKPVVDNCGTSTGTMRIGLPPKFWDNIRG